MICHKLDDDKSLDPGYAFFVISNASASASAVRDNLIAGCVNMKRLLPGLRDSQGRVAEEIHAIRKLGKSLRGGLVLFRMEKSAGLEIQCIGRLLSGSRDAVSRSSTWNKIAWDGDPGMAAAIIGLLEIQVATASRRPAEATVDWCLGRVDAAIAALQALDEAEIVRRLSIGTKKLEQRALKRTHRLSHRNPEDFHEARKSLKAWLGAADFLPPGLPPVPEIYADLAEVLGDENDIATLSHWLERHGFTRKIAPDLHQVLAKKRREIQKVIIRKAAKPKNRSKKPATDSRASPDRPQVTLP